MRLNERLESWVENYLVRECELLGAICSKNQKRRGWPDRTIYWYKGVTDLVETKRPIGGRFEPLQLRTHVKMCKMGHTVLLLSTRIQVDEYVRSRLQFALPGAVTNYHLRQE